MVDRKTGNLTTNAMQMASNEKRVSSDLFSLIFKKYSYINVTVTVSKDARLKVMGFANPPLK